jgi:hypothetical protein
VLDFEGFQRFAQVLPVATKEYGVIPLGKHWNGPQRMVQAAIRRGLAEDVHEFYVLKARQLGISTFFLAWDLYYILRYVSVAGAIVVHDEPARSQFRAMLSMYYKGLVQAAGDDYELPAVIQDNRDQLLLSNNSMFQYKVAGLNETSSKALGRSSALSYAHCTEVAYWGDPDQIGSLRSSMAQKNPLRFFAWESTANGYNQWYEMWQEAQGAASIRPIFIGWWAHEDYRIKAGSRIFQQYWGPKGKPSRQETEWQRQLTERYQFEVTPEQWAWYRWNGAEKTTDEMQMKAEYPTVPEDAFIATGSKFFSLQHMTEGLRRVRSADRKPCQYYKVQFGTEFTDTELVDASPSQANMRVWQEPVPGAHYAIGADPSYGSSATSDHHAAVVLRVWSNRLEQVAEFMVNDIAPHRFAWVIMYLCGAYRRAVYNIELNGSGTAVLQELENVKRIATFSKNPTEKAALKDVTRYISEFLYAREDSIQGRPMGKHTLTTERLKETYLNLLKDNFERGIFVPHSPVMFDQMKAVVRHQGTIEAEGSEHDDLVIAAALANKAWNDQQRTTLIVRGVFWDPQAVEAAAATPVPQAANVLDRTVQGYMRAAGIMPRPKIKNPAVRAYNLKR